MVTGTYIHTNQIDDNIDLTYIYIYIYFKACHAWYCNKPKQYLRMKCKYVQKNTRELQGALSLFISLSLSPEF